VDFLTLEYRDFMNLESLQRKAGSSDISAIVAKEIADNAIDVAGHCCLGRAGENGFYVEDDGPGINIEMLPKLFSVNRELISSKKLRLPTRGALGNGLRVVVGAIYATNGRLTVSTGGKIYNMNIEDDGTTIASYTGEYDKKGTRVEIHLGSGLIVDLRLAQMAVEYAKGKDYKGKTSAHWYTSESFSELFKASHAFTRELVAQFDGCTGARAGAIAATHKGRQADNLTFEESEVLLAGIREAADNINPKRLGSIGDKAGVGYHTGEGVFQIDSVKGVHHAQIPFFVEAWAELNDRPQIKTLVNKTPITGDIWLSDRIKKSLSIYGCGLSCEIEAKPASVVLNVVTPYMPITSDGKEPNLRPMVNVIAETIQKAIKKAARFKPREVVAAAKVSEKEIIRHCLKEAISKASGGGEFRYSQRQLYYAVRPYVMNELGKEPDYNYFSSVITEIETGEGELPGMYRDPRGVLYHPHLKTEIPLGTLAVEEYTRPEWTFNKILYSEKEGFFPILKDTKWSEKHDCALMTSKGYASRAVKDILDLLGETDEELLFFCIHDADAAGTMIYESLQEGTKARPGRKVRIINLGLDPQEALEMGLEVEHVNAKGKKAVASYLSEEWAEWLQDKRVELNAMPTPLFLNWLDKKMEQHGAGKLIPPDDVMIDRLKHEVRQHLQNRITHRILAEAGIDELTGEAYASILPVINERTDGIGAYVSYELHVTPENQWIKPIDKLCKDLIQ
jgi:hypothetical protein